jgi:hypothetical protein
MKRYVWTFSVLSLFLCSACIQEFPVGNSPCPCAEGYKCCDHITGENVCVPAGKPCPCEERACIDPPLPECLDGQVLRYFQTPGRCHLDECSYEPSDITCAVGCQDGACLQEACSGELSWATQAGALGATGGSDIDVLPDGSSLVVGEYDYSVTFGAGEPNQTTLSKTPDQGANLFMARYNPDGTLAWVVEATGNDSNSVSSVAARQDGSFFVTGSFGSTITFGPGEANQTALSRSNQWDAFVAHYNPDGTLAWARGIAGHEDGGRHGTSIAAMPDGSAVVTGYFHFDAIFAHGEPDQTTLESPGSHDVFIARYNPDGTLAWARRAGGNSDDRGTAIAVSPDGGILVAGEFGGDNGDPATFGDGEPNETTLQSEGREDVFIAKYNPDGTLAWARRAGGENPDVPQEISLFPEGSFLVAGESASGSFGTGPGNIFVAKYDTEGELSWSMRVGGEHSNEFGALSSMADGSLLLCGAFQESATFGPGQFHETTLSAAPGEYGYFLARYDGYGYLAWVLQNGGMARGVSTLRDGTALTTGSFAGTATFSQDMEDQKILSARGLADLFLLRNTCPCVVHPEPVPVFGRLWVMPNPLRYNRLPPGFEEGEFWAEIVNVGSEDVVVDSIYLIGDPDFRFPYGNRDFEFTGKSPDFPFPVRIETTEMIFFTMSYRPTTRRVPEAFLVVKTSDPTSPTLRIPIVLDSRYSSTDDAWQEACFLVKPNPIRLETIPFGSTHSVEIGVHPIELGGYNLLRNVTFSTVGEDFSITGITDDFGKELTPPLEIEAHSVSMRVFLEYTPQDDKPENGLMVVQFTDEWELTQSMRIPIVVGKNAFEVRTVFLYFQEDFLDLDTARIEYSVIQGWDVKVADGYFIVHNRESGVEIAHLQGCPFEAATTIDAQDAVFSRDPLEIPFDAKLVILLKTDAGEIFKLGNPVRGEFGLRFQYAPLE